MRPSLRNSFGGSRERRRGRGRHAPVTQPPLTTAAPARTLASSASRRPSDPDAQRVRDAGGPIDKAAYTCECGYAFEAPVSTTVHCPHCGAGQAW
jgi:hypothetical protein